MSDSRRPRRLSIEERAARRDYVLSRGRDRFSALLRVLQAGREMELQPRRRFPFDLGRWAFRMLLVGGGLVVALFVAGAATAILRDVRVDTWEGPDRAVQSGQRLAGCPSVNVLHDDVYPTWIRYGGVVYQKLDLQQTIDEIAPASAGDGESGYTLGRMQLVAGDASPGGEHERLLIVTPPSRLGVVYMPAAGCL